LGYGQTAGSCEYDFHNSTKFLDQVNDYQLLNGLQHVQLELGGKEEVVAEGQGYYPRIHL